uniref:Coagulation factor VII, like n=1 Tax=Myripristis murdjan TaxID=586833 RepID=A0A667ZRD9_9TELE
MIMINLVESVFVNSPEANGFLRRSRRANAGLEEMKRGNLERECLEEKCSYEEAREIFILPQQLLTSCFLCAAVDHCRSGPCKNGATCTNHIDSFVCICWPGYHGRTCDKARLSSYGCLYRNGGCEHFCKDLPGVPHHCHCAPGYRLAQDNTSCLAQHVDSLLSHPVPIPCGKPVNLMTPRIVNGYACPRGQCPWQALLAEDHNYKCGAILLSADWILTAAHCVWGKTPSQFHITVGEHDRSEKEGSEQTRRVSKVLVHPSYNNSTSDCDLALLKLCRPVILGHFAVPICLPALDGSFRRALATVRLSTVSGWGHLAQSGLSSRFLQRLEIPRVPLQECRAHTKLNITRNMLCAGVRKGGQDACQGDSGGPLVTRYKNTWFLSGVVSWGKGCAKENLYGVYVRVSNFLGWINRTMTTG